MTVLRNITRMLICSIIPALFLVSCISGSKIEDRYIVSQGMAKIVSVKSSSYNPDGRNRYVDVFFDFYPDAENSNIQQGMKNVQLFIEGRGNHLREWVRKKGIRSGSFYQALRYEKKSWGGGAPLFYRVMIPGSHQR